MKYPHWFASNGVREDFAYFLEGMRGHPVKALQIGAFTGDASKWLFENILTNSSSVLVDVDTWAGSEEAVHDEFDWSDVEKTYNEKVKPFRKKLYKTKMTSEEYFDKNVMRYDFIYVDGAHTAFDVFNDGISAFECLNEGGIIAFDDYTWDGGKGDFLNPRDGIDGFYLTYIDQLSILHCGTQAWFQKIARPKMLIEGV